MGATHAEVCHNWAHQLKDEQGDQYVSFCGRKVYSYTTVIGEIVFSDVNTPCYFLNVGYFSKSTAKHQRHAFDAIPVDAVRFSVSRGEFMYDWKGIADRNGKIPGYRARDFVMNNLLSVYNSLLEFKDSKALKNEKKFSLEYYNEAVRFMKYFPITSFQKILCIKDDTLKKFFHVENPTVFRKTVNALMDGEKELNVLVNVACGDGTYEAYHKRTAGLRMVDVTKRFNHYCGFTSKGFTGKQIVKYREEGDLVKILYRAKKANNLKACDQSAQRERDLRVAEAKRRLEIFIGLRGWKCHWFGDRYTYMFSKFTYNGVDYVFNRWNDESRLSDSEYTAFATMSSAEQKEFVRAKRAEMLETLHQQDDDYRNELERAEKERLERDRREAEKRQYIEEQKARGDDGLRQLWHENLLSSISLWNQPITLFYGGNVLLKVAESGDKVVTSKGITIPLKECKRLWNIINSWHESKTEFCQNKEIVHATGHQDWNIQRYQNDIMIAGCHAIAYKEMATIAKQLNFC